jgi:hypothetical protein
LPNSGSRPRSAASRLGHRRVEIRNVIADKQAEVCNYIVKPLIRKR